jgi:hypothetical protein
VRHHHQQALIEALRHQPGLIVTSTHEIGSTLIVRGLKDPLATDPSNLAPLHRVPAERVRWEWTPFTSAEPALRESRDAPARQATADAQRLLGARLTEAEERLLRAEKRFPILTLALVEAHCGPLPESVQIEWAKDTLILRGNAPEAWVEALANARPALERVTRLESAGLTALVTKPDPRALIQGARIAFDNATERLTPEGERSIARIAEWLQEINSEAGSGQSKPQLRLHAAPLIGDRLHPNRDVQSQRLSVVQQALSASGIAPELFAPGQVDPPSATEIGTGVRLQVIKPAQ